MVNENSLPAKSIEIGGADAQGYPKQTHLSFIPLPIRLEGPKKWGALLYEKTPHFRVELSSDFPGLGTLSIIERHPMKKSRTKDATPGAARLKFPEDEARYPWLSMLLEGLAVFDRGTALAIQRAKRKQGRPVACSEGCGNCCMVNTDIPVYPLELAGIYWYAIEKLGEPLRGKLKAQLAAHEGKPPCPFLIDNSCSIYPLRPGVCRLFVVFGRPCSPGEDAYHTRNADVLTPLEEFKNQAFFVMLPFYGISRDEDRIRAIENKIIHSRVRNLLECDWKNLAEKMEARGQLVTT